MRLQLAAFFRTRLPLNLTAIVVQVWARLARDQRRYQLRGWG